jgi:hypothetical protein
MKTVHVKSLIKATTYKGLIAEAEKKLSKCISNRKHQKPYNKYGF